MKQKITFLAVSLLIGYQLLYAAPDVKSFVDGKRTNFSTLSHKKAKGLNMTISYPEGWVAKEGEKPNVVQKFVSDGGGGLEMSTIIVKSLPVPKDTKLTDDDLQEFFSDDNLKAMAPEGAKIFNSKRTKVEGLSGAMIEYLAKAERLGMVAEMYNLNYCFIYESNFVSVNFSVNGLPDSKIKIEDRIKDFRPIFLAMANTISIPDKWK